MAHKQRNYYVSEYGISVSPLRAISLQRRTGSNMKILYEINVNWWVVYSAFTLCGRGPNS
jgi:hypothetical protein